MIQEDLFLDQSYILDNGIVNKDDPRVEKTEIKYLGFTVKIYIVQLPNLLWCSSYDIDLINSGAYCPLRPDWYHETTKAGAVFDVYYRVINYLNLEKEKKNVSKLIEYLQNEYMKK